MTESLAQEIWETLHDDLGEDFRVVTRYDGGDFETIMRDDLREQYSPAEDQEIVDGIIIRQLNFAKSESVFKAGSLEAAVRMFESAYIVVYPDSLDEKAGVLVSIERDGNSMTAVEEAIEMLKETVGEERE